MKNLIIVTTCVAVWISLFSVKAYAPPTTADLADRCGITEEEFILMSSVVEAESNRQAPAESELTTEGRIYIALTIWNRVNSDRWPSTVTGVLTQRNQFSTVRNGSSVTNRTEWSDWAVVEAYEWIQSGEEYPDVQFFRCGHYFSGLTPCAEVGGNYFSYG